MGRKRLRRSDCFWAVVGAPAGNDAPQPCSNWYLSWAGSNDFTISNTTAAALGVGMSAETINRLLTEDRDRRPLQITRLQLKSPRPAMVGPSSGPTLPPDSTRDAGTFGGVAKGATQASLVNAHP
ncbi:MAG: hypothetical protein EON54_02215 [Alcaligenaceae bacterium]|nr:MAG: hypothetical protein EON54_02215 [Alcaligenaceae bacterium]